MVIAIIGILAALLLPALSSAKQKAWTAQCQSNLHQISLGMKMYADDANGLYPESGGDIAWDQKDVTTGNYSWLQQIFSCVQNLQNVYRCPTEQMLSPMEQSQFNYFNGARAYHSGKWFCFR